MNALKRLLYIGNKWQSVRYSWHVKIITVASGNRTQRETQRRRRTEISIYEMHTSCSHTLSLLRDLTRQSFILRLNWWIVCRHNWDHFEIKHTGRFIRFHIIQTNWKCITYYLPRLYVSRCILLSLVQNVIFFIHFTKSWSGERLFSRCTIALNVVYFRNMTWVFIQLRNRFYFSSFEHFFLFFVFRLYYYYYCNK